VAAIRFDDGRLQARELGAQAGLVERAFPERLDRFLEFAVGADAREAEGVGFHAAACVRVTSKAERP